MSLDLCIVSKDVRVSLFLVTFKLICFNIILILLIVPLFIFILKLAYVVLLMYSFISQVH